MSVNDLFARTAPFFKHDMPSRVDERIASDAAEAAQKKAWDKAIDLRDTKKCRCCGKASDPDRVGLTTRGHRAHIVYASAGGSNDPSNRVTLCSRCHNDEHRDRLRFTAEGGPYVGINANGCLEFWRKGDDERWYLSRREIAIHRAEKD